MAHGSRASKVSTIAASLVLCGIVAACSGSDSSSAFDDGGGGGGGGGGKGDDDGGFGGFDGGGGGGNLGGDGGTVGVGDAACAATSSKGQQQPLDVYIMLDQSGSMKETVAGGGDKWTAVTGALNTFVKSPLNGVSVGIQYFGLPPGGGNTATCPQTCSSDADCNGGTCVPLLNVCFCPGNGGGLTDSCTAADYAKPDVEIAPLPGNATALSTSIAKHGPTTGTPTSAALQGAVDHAKAWSTAHPDHVTIALFATDGEPQECDLNQTNINAIAAAAASGNPKILTFVIGVGSSLGNLNGIAAAGGTGSAFIVDTTQNVNQQFLDALNKIRGAAVGCQYKIPMPASGTPDYNKVNVQYTPGGGSAQLLPKVSDASKCPASGDAWYYDDNAKPTQILLCDATCKKVTSDATGEVDVLTGCQSVIN